METKPCRPPETLLEEFVNETKRIVGHVEINLYMLAHESVTEKTKSDNITNMSNLLTNWKAVIEQVEQHIAFRDDSPQLQIVQQFNDALNAHDVEGMMRLMTPDCVFENTYPAPDGTRYEGQVAVHTFWEEFFRNSNGASIEIEEIFGIENRCIMRWVYHWTNADGSAGHVRGVDVYRLENGLISEKLSYVKG